MKIALITGSCGLIGSEAVDFLSEKFDLVVGIDNDSRSYFFGEGSSIENDKIRLQLDVENYKHYDLDIRNKIQISQLFSFYSSDIKLIIHTAAQPSHDWAVREPETDFSINAQSTVTLLENFRKYCPNAVFIFTSTNKVYGDTPNSFPYLELSTRWELSEDHPFYQKGINETMSVDQCKHSLFGVSKLSADLMVQEYGKYFGLKTGVFRAGCLTGPNHRGAKLHGFLSYLIRCNLTRTPYIITGYLGKQVRDNLHSYDLVNMFWHFFTAPKIGVVYNVGGGRKSNCSILEAIAISEKISGIELPFSYSPEPRNGDHVWWVTDVSKFESHYPDWSMKYSLEETMLQIQESTAAVLNQQNFK